MITLRPYQQDAVQAIRAAFSQRHRSVLFVLPTGGGKTRRVAPISGGLRNRIPRLTV